jgi:pyruvate dehydrogenase E2 component (dihydrolipoamide acetyltransferase)
VTEFKIPELGENVTTGDVLRVLVKVGDTITRDQPVLELETDKATIEVPSTVAGRVRTIDVAKGDTIGVGAVVLTVDESADTASSAVEPAAESGRAAASDSEIGAPATGEAAQPAGPSAAEVESPAPVVSSQPATTASTPATRVVPMPHRQAPEPSAPGMSSRSGPGRPSGPASPSVRRLAREIGVEVTAVQGTGPAGRISQDDVKEHARRILSSIGSAAGLAARALSRPLPDFEKWGRVERQPWTNVRRTTSEHLSHAWAVIPHVTQFDKADVGALEELRRQFKDRVAQAGGTLTITAMLVQIVATALGKFPQFNASLDTERGEIVFKRYVNVGVAVDTDRGLLVPVIRNADRKNLTEIAVELQRGAERARNRKLTLDEMSGGGMTISNLGGIGGTYFTPIVNWPEVAILGVSRARTEPVWREDQWKPRLMLPLALSYDHRVVDGADAMRFMRWVVDAIEQPFLLSLVG